MTKDEKYLLKLHEMALGQGSPKAHVNRYAVGRLVGLNDKGIDALTRLLAQANFIKNGDGQMIYLTPQGLRLIETIRQGA